MKRAVAVGIALALAGLAAPGGAAERKGGAPERRGIATERRVPASRADEQGSRPIEIAADRLSADSARNSVTFHGNVQAKQGDVVLTSDRLFAEYSKAASAIEKIEADGNVRLQQPGRSATAAKAVFYNLDQRIVLSGGAQLTQGENTLKGETVTIWIRENRSEITGGPGGRVNAVIYPKGLSLDKEPQEK